MGRMASPPGEVTRLLRRIPTGDTAAREELARILHAELRGRAAVQLRRERPDHTLQPTALANEAWMRLVEEERVECEDRTHFFALAATCIRRILVDHARRRAAVRRGGGASRVELELDLQPGGERSRELLGLDDALAGLQALHERKARVVELRFFGGLTNEEIARFLGVSTGTVERDLRLARAWLRRELSSGAEP